jgi:hypothetical protein
MVLMANVGQELPLPVAWGRKDPFAGPAWLAQPGHKRLERVYIYQSSPMIQLRGRTHGREGPLSPVRASRPVSRAMA